MSDPRPAVAEAIGTGLLVAAVIGSGIMAERLAGGNMALALLANALATAGALVALILAFGPISGAQFNPIVTLALALRGDFPRARVAGYMVAQIFGAILGAWLAHLMFAVDILQVSTRHRTGWSQWVSEIVASFGLVFLVLSLARTRPGAIAGAVAAYIGAAYWFTASTSFANPAVTLARAMTDSFAGIAPAHMPGFIACQLIGGGLAVALTRWFARD